MNSTLNVARLVHACGKIDGRKKLQKIVYLLQQMGHEGDFPQEFGYLHYGPYSRQLSSEVDYLSSGDDGLLHEEEMPAGTNRSYSYTPREELSDLLEELKVDQSPDWKRAAVDLARRDAQELEAISTIVYLRGLGFHGAALRARFSALKPGLVGKFELAVDEADRLIPHSISH